MGSFVGLYTPFTAQVAASWDRFLPAATRWPILTLSIISPAGSEIGPINPIRTPNNVNLRRFSMEITSLARTTRTVKPGRTVARTLAIDPEPRSTLRLAVSDPQQYESASVLDLIIQADMPRCASDGVFETAWVEMYDAYLFLGLHWLMLVSTNCLS